MKDKILYHLATARAYHSLAISMRSQVYLESCRNQMRLARLLIQEYNADRTVEFNIKLVA